MTLPKKFMFQCYHSSLRELRVSTIRNVFSEDTICFEHLCVQMQIPPPEQKFPVLQTRKLHTYIILYFH